MPTPGLKGHVYLVRVILGGVDDDAWAGAAGEVAGVTPGTDDEHQEPFVFWEGVSLAGGARQVVQLHEEVQLGVGRGEAEGRWTEAMLQDKLRIRTSFQSFREHSFIQA